MALPLAPLELSLGIEAVKMPRLNSGLLSLMSMTSILTSMTHSHSATPASWAWAHRVCFWNLFSVQWQISLQYSTWSTLHQHHPSWTIAWHFHPCLSLQFCPWSNQESHLQIISGCTFRSIVIKDFYGEFGLSDKCATRSNSFQPDLNMDWLSLSMRPIWRSSKSSVKS